MKFKRQYILTLWACKHQIHILCSEHFVILSWGISVVYTVISKDKKLVRNTTKKKYI
jgi:hypothetical protein